MNRKRIFKQTLIILITILAIGLILAISPNQKVQARTWIGSYVIENGERKNLMSEDTLRI